MVSPSTALAYDATSTVIEALESQKKVTRSGIRKTLAKPNFVAEGATGIIKFNKYGDRHDPPVVLVEVVSCPNQQYKLAFVPVDNIHCDK